MLAWGLVLLWAGLMWVLSGIPDLRSSFDQDYWLRKGAHALEFGVLTFLLLHAISLSIQREPTSIQREQPARFTWPVVGYAAVLALAYALIDEIHQSLVLGRRGAFTDVLIDGLGIGLAVLLTVCLRLRGNSRRARSPR